MNITVIIPSYNGAHKLPVVLQALSKQTLRPQEIIVVDDGSLDRTREVALAFTALLPQLQVVSQPNGGRSSVRNTGARMAASELLVFFDDDMEPATDCLAQHLNHHLQHPGSIMTGAQIDFWEEGISDFRRFKKGLTERWAADLLSSEGKPLGTESIFMTAANCSMPAVIFSSLKGFDERLRDAEDYDMALRASKAGIPLYYNHRAFATHHDVATVASYIKRSEQYRHAQMQLRALFPDRENKYLAPKISGVKALLFRVFAGSLWVPLIDKGILKALLPESIRYRIYDWVITAHGNMDEK